VPAVSRDQRGERMQAPGWPPPYVRDAFEVKRPAHLLAVVRDGDVNKDRSTASGSNVALLSLPPLVSAYPERQSSSVSLVTAGLRLPEGP
jgi:hypothetical protein